MIPLRFYTLGRFEVYRDGDPVPRTAWGTHRAITLCKVLLTHPNQRLHKEQLQAWIWPDASPAAAARNLRVALSELRRALAPDRCPGDSDGIIVSMDQTLTLSEDHVWVDKFILRQTVEACSDNVGSIEMLRSALSLYHGLYLPDDLYADWSHLERESLALVYETGLLKLVDAYAARSDFENALRVSRRALVNHPTDEAFAERLMRYALELGEYGLALRAFESLRGALQVDLDVEPSPCLVELAAEIRAAGRFRSTATARPSAPRSYEDSSAVTVGRLQLTLDRSTYLFGELQTALMRVRESRARFDSSAEEARAASTQRADGRATLTS